MKHYLYTLLAAALIFAGISENASAKRVVAPQMYMFGFAASFSDTIVYFSDIQTIDSAWIDSRSNFLQSRDVYAAQFWDFLTANKQMRHRTCVVFYNKNRAQLEKKFVKMRRLYSKGKDGREHFDVRQLDAGEFRFRPIDLSELDAMEKAQAKEDEMADKDARKAAKAEKKDNKKQKKPEKRSGE